MPASVRAFLFKRAPEGGLSYKVKKRTIYGIFTLRKSFSLSLSTSQRFL